MNLFRFLWILPFLCFLIGYQSIRSLYHVSTLKTPSLLGKDIHQALKILSDHNLNARILTEKEDPELPAGTILHQNPLADSVIKTQQSVFLVVSTKPNLISMPSVVHYRCEEAQEKLKKLGLASKIYEIPSSYPKRTCLAQFPQPGTLCNVADSTVLYCSSESNKPVIMPNVINAGIVDVLEFFSSQGIAPSLHDAHTAPEGHTCKTCFISDQRPAPGSLLRLTGEKPHTIRLQVTHN